MNSNCARPELDPEIFFSLALVQFYWNKLTWELQKEGVANHQPHPYPNISPPSACEIIFVDCPITNGTKEIGCSILSGHIITYLPSREQFLPWTHFPLLLYISPQGQKRIHCS